MLLYALAVTLVALAGWALVGLLLVRLQSNERERHHLYDLGKRYEMSLREWSSLALRRWPPDTSLPD